MSDRTTAWIQFGPWDEERLASTEDGCTFLKLLEEFGFDEQEVVHESDTDTLQCDVHEAQYGTCVFDEAGLVGRAQHLGLWCLQGDEGCGNWDWHYAVFSPVKRMDTYTCGAEGRVLLEQERFDALVSHLDDAGVVAAIRKYFTEGSKTLGEWISAEGERQGRS